MLFSMYYDQAQQRGNMWLVFTIRLRRNVFRRPTRDFFEKNPLLALTISDKEFKRNVLSPPVPHC